MAEAFTIDDLADECRSWLGTPYVHQYGKKLLGADCLGFVLGVVSKFNPNLTTSMPKYSPHWSELANTDVLLESANEHLLPAGGSVHGTVTLFKMRRASVSKHCGITLVEEGVEFLYHSMSGHGVIKSGMTDDWNRKISGRFLVPGVEYVNGR